MEPGEKPVTAQELADELNLSPVTVLRRFNAGEWPGFRIGGPTTALRFYRSEVLAVIRGAVSHGADARRTPVGAVRSVR